MTPEERLVQITEALEAAGLDSLVMGGHAVRYYGVDRNTVDFDFVTGTEAPDLRARLNQSPLLNSPREGPSWRPDDFARFEIGRLPDGREEWLEFWFHNHLLPDFEELRSRQERGTYGGKDVRFISLSDLLRSKETERESDWQDIALLEEIQDARLLATARTDADLVTALANLRSRRGFERAAEMGLFPDLALVTAASSRCVHPVPYAFLRPLAADLPPPAPLRMPIEDAYLAPLGAVAFATTKHLALVEVVRRAYKRWAMEQDRQDKQSRVHFP
jgi:hypothetical protein